MKNALFPFRVDIPNHLGSDRQIGRICGKKVPRDSPALEIEFLKILKEK